MWKTNYRVAILTSSDKGARGEREDLSGPIIRARMESIGCRVTAAALLPDDEPGLARQLRAWCDGAVADLILTTGGTGLSPRDRMPEATLSVAERVVPGIPEAMRAHGLSITPKAMLSRAAAAIRGQTLIVNLPGSPKAVSENLDAILPALEHGLDMLCGSFGECAGPSGGKPHG